MLTEPPLKQWKSARPICQLKNFSTQIRDISPLQVQITKTSLTKNVSQPKIQSKTIIYVQKKLEFVRAAATNGNRLV